MVLPFLSVFYWNGDIYELRETSGDKNIYLSKQPDNAFISSLAQDLLKETPSMNLEIYEKVKNGTIKKWIPYVLRLMYATLLVADVYSRNADVLHNPLISNTLSILTTQRIVKTITVLVNIATQVLPAVLDGATSTSSADSAKAGDDK